MNFNIIIFLIILSYISGSIPYGLIITKIFGYGDIRNFGSGNIGTTNVLRKTNKKIAVAVLFFDFMKCYIPIYVVNIFFDTNTAAICGLFTIIGHIFPVWLKFKGGKGVACLFGFLFAINPMFFLITLIIWFIVVLVTKYSSLSSIISVFTMFFLFIIYDSNINIVIPITIIALIIYKHILNIKRLINKTETKIKI